MNQASPFAAAGEHFTIRELTVLLPPQLVRADAPPGDQPVVLPLDALRQSLEMGRPALRLSQIFLACPYLFNRQIQPSEDHEVALPWQKVKRMIEGGGQAIASPFAAVAPPAARGDSPFAPAGSPFPAASQVVSPFAARQQEPAAQNEVLSPFSTESLPSLDAVPAAPSPFQRLEAPSAPRPASSPFVLVPQAAPEVPAPAPSPFIPSGNGNGKPPVATAPQPAAAPAPNPFESNAPVSSPASLPAGAPPVPMTPRPLDAAAATEAPSVDSQRITVLLAALMRGVTADDLGFEPAAVPDHIEVALSLDMIMPQLATGRVEVGVEDLRQGVAERLRPAFAKMRPGLRFQVPLTEIFKYLSPGAIPVPQTAPHVPISTSPFQTPFALKADEDAQDAPPALPSLVVAAPPPPAADALPSFPIPPALASTPRIQSAPIMLPPPPAPPSAAPEPAPAFSLPSAPGLPPAAPGVGAIKLPGIPGMPGMPSLPKLPGAGKPSAFSRPPGAPPPPDTPPASPLPPFAAPPTRLPAAPGAEGLHDDLGQPFQAGMLRAEPPSLAQAKGPFNPSSLFSAPPAEPPAAPAPRPAPVAVAAPAPAAPAAPPIEFNFGETPDMVRVTLRALFDSENDLTLHEIVERLAKLPGLRSAIAITGGGLISSGHDSGHEEVVQFRNSAAKSHEYLAGLAESMGYGGSGSFTLRAGSSVRTFFIENGNCLAVLHANSTFAPGVREKLIITSRLLRDLAD